MSISTLELTEKQIATIPEQAQSIVVDSNEKYMKGEELLAACKSLEKKIHDVLDPIIDKAYQAHKEAVSQRKKYLEPIEEGRKILKQKMIAYQDEQERIRREEQTRLEAEAKKRTEEEALQMALQAEAMGDKEMAQAIINTPIMATAVIAPKITPQASRLSAGRSVWNAEVVNLMALVKAVAEGKQPITLLEPNMQTLNGLAKSLKSSLNIPGVKAIEKKV